MGSPPRLCRVIPQTPGSPLAAAEWVIEFSAPRHPSVAAASAQLMRRDGTEVSLELSDPRLAEGECLVRARGNAFQLRRLLERFDRLLRGFGVELEGGFTGTPFQRRAEGPEAEVG